MRIVIIVAMDKEMKLFLNILDNSIKHKDLFGSDIYTGIIGEHEVILTKSGIGKVNSSLVTSYVITMFRPDLIINSGVAGSVDETAKIGDVLVPLKITYHDLWCGSGTTYGQADGCPIYFKPFEQGIDIIKKLITDRQIKYGLLCSGDKFIMYPDDVQGIKMYFPHALGCDMESASIAQTCYKYGTPFIVIRVLSDRPGSGDNLKEYNNFWETAPQQTFDIVKQFIEKL